MAHRIGTHSGEPAPGPPGSGSSSVWSEWPAQQGRAGSDWVGSSGSCLAPGGEGGQVTSEPPRPRCWAGQGRGWPCGDRAPGSGPCCLPASYVTGAEASASGMRPPPELCLPALLPQRGQARGHGKCVRVEGLLPLVLAEDRGAPATVLPVSLGACLGCS